MLTVGVLFGGRSGEHDVSLCSAASVVAAMDPSRYNVVAIGIDRDGRWYVQDSPVIVDDRDFGRILKLEKKGNWFVNHFEDGNRLVLFDADSNRKVSVDVVFPAVHGTYCEDGTLQGLLELAMVPYVGADSVGSSIGIDKDVTKRLLRDGGIPVVPWVTIFKDEWDRDTETILNAIKENIPLPLFVKPARTGSSVGVKKVKAHGELAGAIDFAFQYDTKLLIEKGIDAREIECSVLGNNEPMASVPGEVRTRHEFYSYESKYIDPDGAELVIPAAIDDAVSASIRAAAVEGYRILCCGGMARVDFFLDKNTGEYFLNEINTLPGFTSISMYPKLWAHSGLEYPALIDRLIELAIERHRARAGIRTRI
ncbi:MAG TPA: D-alanine--D-alanine ligase family protein [Spirochaetota bacterium]|nr:D-alanine--D-alanine ligase family protein [Spirochaetota bacterium]HPC41052.1 D-alanine--D-alanine ligase family protein [Spirochaetota bacterium]HPL18530.1 D-alanine--D-alanine ligase family protein [Spirochaetota bacterium]HQF08835.1 D-alanine--D-alanine ligase family protein [Spirochaetota bacterium]HQH97454.1 D-alanine--D-alanine ligase family protein [Spirochaetota bacterium]